jgi:transcriptional regulator with XRE-family HTH domain
VGFFKRNKSLSQLSARRLANKLHDAGMTDREIADAIGASRSQVCKIRSGHEPGTLLRPRLLALVEGRTPAVFADKHHPKTPARPSHPVRQQPRSALATPVVLAARTSTRTPGHVAPPGRTDNRTLKRAYVVLRENGFSDAEA